MFPNDLFSMFDDMLGTHSHSNNNMTNRLLARLDRNARSALMNANKFSNLAESNQTNIEHLFTSILEILANNNITVISDFKKAQKIKIFRSRGLNFLTSDFCREPSKLKANFLTSKFLILHVVSTFLGCV